MPNQKEHSYKQTALPNIVSLFCGAGGLDWGFKNEGFKISLAIDHDTSAIRTYKRNFKRTKSIAADLNKIGPLGVLSFLKDRLEFGSRIGIIGGPPCQGFSRSNPLASPNDPRNLLPALYVNIIKELQKKYDVEFIIFENVLGMKDKKHAEKYNKLISGLIKLGFTVDEYKLCALDFGVPQKRNRIVVSAMKKGKGYSKVLPIKKTGITTVREAIGNLEEPAYFDRKLKPVEIPIHPNHWTMNPKSKRFSPMYTSNKPSRSFRRLSWDKASPTIAFGNREIHIHPEGKRRISIYEAMLLQGFPNSYVLEGTFSNQATQISNAVPPPLAKSIAAAIKTSLLFK